MTCDTEMGTAIETWGIGRLTLSDIHPMEQVTQR
jgi:hypothetical protein